MICFSGTRRRQGHSIILFAFEWQKQLQFLRHFVLPNQSVICGLGTLSIALVCSVLSPSSLPFLQMAVYLAVVVVVGTVKWSIRWQSWRCLQFLFHLPVNEHWKCVKCHPLHGAQLVFNCLQVAGMAFNEVLNDTPALVWLQSSWFITWDALKY